jgi:hypothetical protein
MKPRPPKRNRQPRTRRPSRVAGASQTLSVPSASDATQTAAHAPDVEERLRISLILIDGVYHLDELADAEEHVRFEAIEAKDLRDQIPRLAEALREQVLAIRAALPFECQIRAAPAYVQRPREHVSVGEQEIPQPTDVGAPRVQMKTKGGAR